MVATLIGIASIFDAVLIGTPTLAQPAWFNPLIVFVVVAVIVTMVNIAAFNWLDRKWKAWIVSSRFEAKLQQITSAKRARRPVEWISRGSDAWFGLGGRRAQRHPGHLLEPTHRRTPGRRAPQLVAAVAYSVSAAAIV